MSNRHHFVVRSQHMLLLTEIQILNNIKEICRHGNFYCVIYILFIDFQCSLMWPYVAFSGDCDVNLQSFNTLIHIVEL